MREGRSPRIIVVGAGVAGLAAAAAIRAQRQTCLVLEASGRVGGRAHTTSPDALGGAPFDHGAAWLHDGAHNPLSEIALAHGERLVDSDRAGVQRSFVDGRPAGVAATAAYDRAWEDFERTVARALEGAADMSLADAARSLDGTPWAATVAAWQGAVIAAADARDLSARDWQANALRGSNLMVHGGLGRFVQRALAPPAGEVRLSTPVARITWNGHGVVLDTPSGQIAADACIVTVSTGVLAAGGIVFEPDLPEPIQAAIAGLPMGLATKVGLRAAGADRLDLPPFTSIDRALADADEPSMVFFAWPFGHDHVIGYVGGRAAWALAAEGPGAAEAFARAEWRRCFGSSGDRCFVPGAVVTGWDCDPLMRGAYAYARPGQAAAREALAAPIAEGRLMLAGEACHKTLAGTVAGAYLSGQAAARAVMQGIGLL